MKNLKTFKEFVNESNNLIYESRVPRELSRLGKWKSEKIDSEGALDGYEGTYTKVDSYTLITGTPLDDQGIYVNVYDDKDFAIFYDSAPIPLSSHSNAEKMHMYSVQTEVPLPLSYLNKSELTKIISDLSAELDENYSLNESKVTGSKIGSHYSVAKNGEVTFGYKYKEYQEDNYDEIELWDDSELENEVGPSMDAYVKSLKGNLTKAYSHLDANTKKIQSFINSIDGGIFGGETYNGWTYMEQAEDTYAKEENPEEYATMTTLLYIISKIEAYLHYRSTK